jgi:hypothetical protein
VLSEEGEQAVTMKRTQEKQYTFQKKNLVFRKGKTNFGHDFIYIYVYYLSLSMDRILMT